MESTVAKNSVKVYLRANGSHWFALGQQGKAQITVLNLPSDLKQGLNEILTESLIKTGLQLPTSQKTKIFCSGPDLIAINEVKPVGVFSGKSDEQLQSAILNLHANSLASTFRNFTKSRLIEALSTADTSEKTLAAFKEYTAFDGYSCWLYNPETKCFTLIAKDQKSSVSVVALNAVPLFEKALETDEVLSVKGSDFELIPDFPSESCVDAQIFSVKTIDTLHGANQFSVVVCFYTRHSGYSLRPKTAQLIRSSLSQSLARRYFDRILQLNELRAQVRAMREIDNLERIAHEICKLTSQLFKWEAVSVYLKNPASEPDALVRIGAYFESGESDIEQIPEYRLNAPSLTASVYVTGKAQWSYDIDKDPRNSHTYDDKTMAGGKNWIGVPIIAQGSSETLGVLRVKNRLNRTGEESENFSVLDLHNLSAVSCDLASIIDQYSRYSERKSSLEKRAAELRELTDFLRTFRHEIRSPIQAICFAPDRLLLILRDLEFLKDMGSVPPKLRDYLADLKATGLRLEMISKALTLAPEDLVKSLEPRSVYKDCIAPVLAFTEVHARKRGRRLWCNKDSLMAMVLGDSTALSMAFHVLVDNAIKYSDRGSLIKIYGERHSGSRFRICVESSSDVFTISADECEGIFKKYRRGAVAESQKMEGSGIGLFLASRISELHGGSVVLSSRTKPIKFVIELPLK